MNDPFQQAPPPPGGPPQGFDPRMVPPGQQYGIAPLVEEQDGWGKIGIVMVALAVVFAGGVAFFIATSGSSQSDDPEAAAAALAESEVSDGGAEDVASTSAAATAAADENEDEEPEPDDGGEDENAEPVAVVEEADAGAAAETSPPDPGPDLDDVGGNIGLLRENGEVDRPAGLISLSIESEPSGAIVIRKRDGVRLGTTPYRYETEYSAANIGFVLQLEGYRSMSISMPGNQDGVRQVMLLPGSGGAPIPESQPAPTTKSSVKTVAKTTSADPAPKKTKVAASKPKSPAKPKSRAKPKRPSKPSKPKKPSGGKVDYNADPIPL